MIAIKPFLKPEDITCELTNTPQITFEVTDSCNLNCRYCNYGDIYYDHDPRENKKIREISAYKLIDYMNDLWNSEYNCSQNKNTYISFYGGEPLLNFGFIKNIVEYIEKLQKSNRTFTFSMTTNGVLLNKYMDYFVEKKFSLLISLDGNEENSIYRVDKKGNSVFQRIIENVEKLREKHPEYFEKNVNFNAVLHNKNSVESIHSFFRQKYNKIAAIGELNNVGIRTQKKEEFRKLYRSSFNSLLESSNYSEIERDMFISSPTYNSVALFLIQYSDFVYNDYNDLLFGKGTMENICPTGTCLPFSKKIFLTVNGKILPCEKIGHQFALGTITEKGVELDFQRIADSYNRLYSKVEKQCLSCRNRKSCIQCMFNLHDIEKSKVSCHGFMDRGNFEHYKKNQLDFLKRNPDAYSKIMNEVMFQ